jgi:hypothetical protein
MPVPGAPDRPVFLAQLQPFATANPIASPVSIALELLGLRVPYPNPKIVMAGLVPGIHAVSGKPITGVCGCRMATEHVWTAPKCKG